MTLRRNCYGWSFLCFVGPYEFFFDGMQYYTYSNYYFTPSASGSLYMRATSFDSEGEQIRIKLYKANDTYPVYTWTGNPENIYGLAFNGLNQGNLYYFKFEAYESPYVTGWGYICHSYNDIWAYDILVKEYKCDLIILSCSLKAV